MNQKIQIYRALSDNSFLGLLPKLRSGNGPIDVTIYCPYMRKSYEKEKIDEFNVEFKRRGIRRLSFVFKVKKCLDLLNCFVEVVPEKFHFSIAFNADALYDTKLLFSLIRKINPKIFAFRIHLASSSKDFVSTLSEKFENLITQLDTFNAYIQSNTDISISGLNSRQVLDKLSSFDCIRLEMHSICCPPCFGYKLGFLSVRMIYVSIKASDIILAFHLLFKRIKQSLSLEIHDIEKVESLLPLFVPTSKELKIILNTSESITNRRELKTILKYKQSFLTDMVNIFCISRAESAFLTKYQKL